MNSDKSLIFTGTQVNYYFVCKRKLWMFSRQLNQEQTSDAVALGKLLHETSYARKRKEIEIGPIKIDFLKGCEVHEIKKSKKIEKAHEWQLLYYLWFLKQKGIEAKGMIDYPLLKQRVEVILTEEKEGEILKILDGIKAIISRESPPEAIKVSYCKKCSYFELCRC